MKYVYKIISAVLAIAVIPIAFFAPIFHYSVQSTALQAILYFAQQKGIDRVSEMLESYDSIPDTIGNSLSIVTIIKRVTTIFGGDSLKTNEYIEAAVEQLKTPAITSAVIFVLILICGIVTAILAIKTKNNRKVIFSSLAGIGLSFMFGFSFSSLVEPITSGEINLASLTDMNSIIGALIANVTDLSLTASFWLIPVIFGGIALWTVLYNYTLPEKEKLERKRMLGEYKEENV